MGIYSIEFTDVFNRNLMKIINVNEQSKFLIQEVDKIKERLDLFPYCYPLYVSSVKEEFRKIILKWYIVLYGIDEENRKIYIYNIFYQTENWQSKISS